MGLGGAFAPLPLLRLGLVPSGSFLTAGTGRVLERGLWRGRRGESVSPSHCVTGLEACDCAIHARAGSLGGIESSGSNQDCIFLVEYVSGETGWEGRGEGAWAGKRREQPRCSFPLTPPNFWEFLIRRCMRRGITCFFFARCLAHHPGTSVDQFSSGRGGRTTQQVIALLPAPSAFLICFLLVSHLWRALWPETRTRRWCGVQTSLVPSRRLLLCGRPCRDGEEASTPPGGGSSRAAERTRPWRRCRPRRARRAPSGRDLTDEKGTPKKNGGRRSEQQQEVERHFFVLHRKKGI